MNFILFVLTEELAFNSYINLYDQVGFINNNGLSYIGSNITGSSTVPQLTAFYMTSTYTSNTVYPQEMLAMLAQLGFNVTVDASKSLGGVNLLGGMNELVQKVFSFIDKFPPFMAPNTANQSYIIFNNSGGGANPIANQWIIKLRDLQQEITDSKLTDEQKILPLVALSVLNYAFTFFQNVYYNTGGGTAWYSYITANVGSINDLDWRQVIQQNIKGALAGAVQGQLNEPDNVTGGIITGAATAGMAAAAQNIVNQVNIISAYNP